MEKYDIVVIGGGPAGYNAAEYAAAKKQHVLLVEKDRLGGTCLNRGCIPTKAFLFEAKKHAYAVEKMTNEELPFAHEEVLAKKEKVVDQLVSGIASTMTRKGVTVVSGEAAMSRGKDGIVVTVNDKEYFGHNIIIATGSCPVVPRIEGIDEAMKSGVVVTSDELLDEKNIPEKLLIVGGGVIGFEMASYFNEAGSKVTIVEMMDKVLGPCDREVSGLLQKEMEARGVEIKLSARVTAFSEAGVTVESGNEKTVLQFDKVLMAVGRRPILPSGIEQLGIAVRRGKIITNEAMQTNVSGVYAIGDVNESIMLAHVGYREGEVAVNTILGEKDRMDYSAIPSAVYTHPEAAFAGVSEEEAKAAGIRYTVKKVSINFSGRHVVENGFSKGICKLIIDQSKDTIIGAAVMSSYASEYIYALALMIQNRIPVKSITRTVFPHPTVCEIIREALLS